MKTVAITGASGFVGTSLRKDFQKKGFEVRVVQRKMLQDTHALVQTLRGCDIVINLAGASIISRWSDGYKKLLYSSRIDTTKALIQAFEQLTDKPELFISTSAVGIYNNKKVHSEEDFVYGDDFLAKVCQDWEDEANKAKDMNIRTAIFRFGIVLGSDGGALQKMLLPFKMGVGGTIGDGSQAFSFIHIDDLVRAYEHVIENSSCEGVFNLTAPHPTTNKGLTQALGKSLHRPTVLPVPEFVLGIIFGEGARVLTDGQSAVPKHLQQCGFEFEYKDIEQTIQNLV